MKTGFIGAGKVGFTLGKFFAANNIQVTGYYSRRRESAKEAAAFTKTAAYDSIGELIKDSDAVFLTVPDSVIASVFEELKEFDLAGRLICHCSGAMTAHEAFPGIKDTGAYGYSIHPLFPIHSKYDTYRELAGAFFCLEGDSLHIDYWYDLLRSMGVTAKIIASDVKVKYHAACTISSNLVCALVQESLNLMETCGFTGSSALEALTPLIQCNIMNILKEGPAKALTGPVERNDISTIKKHLDCFPTQTEKNLYRELSCELIKVAEGKNSHTDYTELKNVLNEEII